MVAFPFDVSDSVRRWHRWSRWTACIAMTVALVLLPGCSGCGKTKKTNASKKQTSLEDELKKRKAAQKKKKKKPDFEIGQLRTLPSDSTALGNFVKPGHFVTAAVAARANHFDFRGRFNTAAVDRQGRPVFVEGTKYHVTMTRAAALPKGQEKLLSSTFFMPRVTSEGMRQVFLQHSLRAVGGGNVVSPRNQVTRHMPAYQYLLLVLADNPNAYNYVKQLESVQPPYDELNSDMERVVYYRVVLPDNRQRIGLPTHPFAYTSLAYILWDGVHPDRLSPGQQKALLDWLFWGGQIIVSGPQSSDLLKDSFLQPYLPALSAGATALGPADLAELNRAWSLRRARTGDVMGLNVLAEKPLAGVRLKTLDQGTYVPGTGRLVAERRVGRGRIVVTGFGLTSRAIVNWPSFDSFFNAVLLRRPARRFIAGKYGIPRVVWSNYPALATDARFSTATRYFARDVGATPGSESPPDADWHMDGSRPDSESGIGGWNNHSGAAEAAHRALQKAAGIKIPRAAFVVRVLIVYLLILVPVNWGFFRLIGRVEWAWIAALVIAVVGALIVIRLAQLDIGFARSRTELAIMEMQPARTRVHVTRYLALYTSLASRYEFRFPDDPDAVALPFPPVDSARRPREIVFHRDRDAWLTGFQVISSRTAFVHCEQMRDLGATIELVGEGDSLQLANHTKLDLHDAGLLRRAADGHVESCRLGEVGAESRRAVRFHAAAANQPWIPEWYTIQTSPDADTTLDLRKVFELAARRWRLRPGDIRLVGWTEQPVGGIVITPSATHRLIRTVLLVHLRYGKLAAPRPDANLISDVRPAERQKASELEGKPRPIRPAAPKRPGQPLQ